jgi:hypothetical protein
MTCAPLIFLALFASLPAGQTQDSAQTPPARNWFLPLFTKEGYHSMTLRGSEVKPRGVDRIDVTDLNITTFMGGAAAKVDAVLLSPSASFFLKERMASGSGPVRLIRDDVDVTGIDWVYLHSDKKVSIAKNARVVFKAPLPDILK